MKKADFKKMAQMGMACGMLLAAQAPINGAELGGTTVAKACGGSGGCGGRTTPKTYNSNGCNSSTAPQYGNNGCSGRRSDGYTADNSMDTTTTQGGMRVVTDSELRSRLTTQRVRDLYERLSPEAKAFAQRLVGQGFNADDAVDQATQQAGKRTSMTTTTSGSDDLSLGESYNTSAPGSMNPYNSTSSMSNPNYPSSMQGQNAPTYNPGTYNPYGGLKALKVIHQHRQHLLIIHKKRFVAKKGISEGASPRASSFFSIV